MLRVEDGFKKPQEVRKKTTSEDAESAFGYEKNQETPQRGLMRTGPSLAHDKHIGFCGSVGQCQGRKLLNTQQYITLAEADYWNTAPKWGDESRNG